ncbi:MAG: YscO family type III secretion system apparatus protein [Planctomycetota bacterium]|nr:YscO family type III secretion system apparatus protein [Planctomycetota bacterium]
MLKYPLEGLLDVRRRREDDAAVVVREARAAHETAVQDKEQAEWTLRDYQRQRHELENRRYSEVLGQQVHRLELDDLMFDLGQFAQRENELMQSSLEADKVVEQRREELTQAEAGYSAAYRARAKIDEHRKIWLRKAEQEAERQQEKEFEDFRVRKETS